MVSLPNIISFARLVSVPLVVWLITVGKIDAAFWLFLAAGASDAVDGFIAKRFNRSSELGRVLDPLADKALLISIYVALGLVAYLPSWIVILVVSRDAFIGIAFLVSFLLGHRIEVQPMAISKLNTGLQIALAALILAAGAFTFSAGEAVDWLTILVGLTTVASGGLYLMRWLRGLAEAE